MTEKVLNEGFVSLVDRMGDDYSILRAARVSTGNEAAKGEKKDRGLIRYLYRNQHLTPFEMVNMTFHVKLPIFVARQFMRQRTFSYNEFSARYSVMPNEFYVPEGFRLQSRKNHQASEGTLDTEKNVEYIDSYLTTLQQTEMLYDRFLEDGVAREQARAILPVSQYTQFFFNADLRNLFHFLELRLSTHAQTEIRLYAEAILNILKSIEGLQWSVEIFEEMNDVNEMYNQLLDMHKKDLNGLKKKLKGLMQEEKYE